jgi:hypothetical protein
LWFGVQGVSSILHVEGFCDASGCRVLKSGLGNLDSGDYKLKLNLRIRVWVCGIEVWGLGCSVQGTRFAVQGSGFNVQGSGFNVHGSGCSVQSSGFNV